MKKLLRLPILCCLVLATMAFMSIRRTTSARIVEPQKSKSLVGHWQYTFPKGVWIWNIRPDGTFSVASKGKVFANGEYRVKKGIYDTNDAFCNIDYHGTYTFAFFAEDSLRFTVIADTCHRRRGGIDGLGWKRLPETAP